MEKPSAAEGLMPPKRLVIKGLQEFYGKDGQKTVFFLFCYHSKKIV
jgi:hypothetical protein